MASRLCLSVYFLLAVTYSCAKPIQELSADHSGQDGNFLQTTTMTGHEGLTDPEHTGHMDHTDHDHTGHMDHTDHDHTGHMDHTDHYHTDHDDHTGHPEHPDGGHGSHPMWFHATEHATIWFEGWHTMTWAEMLGSCIAIAVIGALYEGFKVLRESMLIKTRRSKQQYCLPNNPSTADKAMNSTMHMLKTGSPTPSFRESLTSGSHIVQSLLHMVQVLLSMLLMLVFMTYNVYLCLAVLVGAGLGYYLFAWRSAHSAYNGDCCN